MSAETIVDCLERHAHERPDAPAVLSSHRAVTYRELHARVGGCADWLRSYDVGSGERVGVSIADDLTHLVVALGLASLGAAHTTLATHDAAPARSRLAARTGVRRVVAASSEPRLPGLGLVTLDADRMAMWARRAPTRLARPDPSSLFTFFTTSGTTGEAKIIPIVHERIAHHAARVPAGRSLPLSTIEHYFAKRAFIFAILAGSAVAIRESPDQPVAPLCAALGVDVLVCMSAQARDLLAAAPRFGRLPPTTLLVLSGERVARPARRQFLEQLCDAVAVNYGTQESGSVARVVERDPRTVTDTVGRPHAGVDVEIVDALGTPLPRGDVGEIRVRAPGMAPGYFDDDRATARHFRDGWFQPGDLASFTPDGTLIVHGRADEVMNLNGIKIAPVEIERALERHPAVKAVAAFPLRSGVHGEIPVAAVELAEGARADERELKSFARDALGLRAPRRVTIVAALPVTLQGKVDRQRLAAMCAAPAPPSGVASAPEA